MPHSTVPSNITPSTSTAEDVAAKLDQILHAILPLHDLLQAQEEMDESLADRLSEILRGLQRNSDHLKSSADALSRLAAAEELPSAHQRAVDAQNVRMDRLDARITAMHRDIQSLGEWLGAKPGQAVAPASSGAS